MNSKERRKFIWYLESILILLVALGFSSQSIAVPPEKYPYAVRYEGFAIGECPGFTILWDGTIEGTDTVFFDKNGVQVRVSSHTRFTDTLFYNSADPSYSVAGIPVNIENDKYDLVNMLLQISGMPVNITVPGYGVIWHWPGKLVRNLSTGEVIFTAADSANHNQEDLSAICAYLAQD
jgi:hypothetical protein